MLLPVVSLTVRLDEETTVWSRPPRSSESGAVADTEVIIAQLNWYFFRVFGILYDSGGMLSNLTAGAFAGE